MKHFFILNPCAGKGTNLQALVQSIEHVAQQCGVEFLVHTTLCPGDATKFVKQMCQTHTEPLRFYACGGDGTLNEVVNGAVGFLHASVGCIPCGTGNDFVKNFADAPFLDLRAQLTGQARDIDLIRCGDRYAINVCNAGFDANVAHHMTKFKNLPLLKSGSGAYTLSILYSVFQKMGNNCTLVFDDNETLIQTSLLTAVANGLCYGGGYYAAPLAKVDDGQLDVCVVKNLPMHKILQLMTYYKNGEHLQTPAILKYIHYQTCKKVELCYNEPVKVSIDGEIIQTCHIAFEVVPKALSFIVPDADQHTCLEGIG